MEHIFTARAIHEAENLVDKGCAHGGTHTSSLCPEERLTPERRRGSVPCRSIRSLVISEGWNLYSAGDNRCRTELPSFQGVLQVRAEGKAHSYC
jgi:hypothetical protein